MKKALFLLLLFPVAVQAELFAQSRDGAVQITLSMTTSCKHVEVVKKRVPQQLGLMFMGGRGRWTDGKHYDLCWAEIDHPVVGGVMLLVWEDGGLGEIPSAAFEEKGL